jgi:hypothetical protein
MTPPNCCPPQEPPPPDLYETIQIATEIGIIKANHRLHLLKLRLREASAPFLPCAALP